MKSETEPVPMYQQILLHNILRERLEQNEKETNTWTSYKKRHKKVIEGLQVFPLSVTENCMIPLGKLAFMKGKLIHTNEVLACLGDGYFAKYSASQAIELCNRKISNADEILRRLENERNLYEMRQILPAEYDVFGEEDKKDIFEHWNEDKLNEWKIQHRQREKEYHQKLAELRQKKKTDICTEEDLFKRLDELELEEELQDEMYRLEDERRRFYGDDLEEGEVYDEFEEDGDTSDSDQITIEMLQDELTKLKDFQKNEVTNDTPNVSSSSDTTENKTFNTNPTADEESNHTVKSIQEKSEESCSTESGNTPEGTTVERKKKVSFVEPCDRNDTDDETPIFEVSHHTKEDNICNEENDDVIRIEFSHSSNVPNTTVSNNTEIQSPVDIYKMFSASIKPILKRSPNDMFPNEAVPPLHEDSGTDTDDECYIKPSAYGSIVKDIQEKKATVTSVNNIIKNNQSRTVSRFKMERVGNTK